jgi:hypothetical protein
MRFWSVCLTLWLIAASTQAQSDPLHEAIRAVAEGRPEEAWRLAAEIRFSPSDPLAVKRPAARRANLAARIASEYSAAQWMRSNRRYSSPDAVIELAGVALVAYPLEPEFWRDFENLAARQGGLSRRSASWLGSAAIPFTEPAERTFLIDVLALMRNEQVESAEDKLKGWVRDPRSSSTCVSGILLAELEISRQRAGHAFELTRDRVGCPGARTRIGRVAEALHTHRNDWSFYQAWLEDDPHDVDARQVAISLLDDDLLRSRARDTGDHEWDIVNSVLRTPASADAWRRLWADSVNRQSFSTMEKALDYKISRSFPFVRQDEKEIARARFARGVMELSRADHKQALESFRLAARELPQSADCALGLVLASAWVHQEQGHAHFRTLQSVDTRLADTIDPEHFERCVNGASECELGSILRRKPESMVGEAFEVGLDKEMAGRDEIAKLKSEMRSVESAMNNLSVRQVQADATIADFRTAVAEQMKRIVDATVQSVAQQLEAVRILNSHADERVEALRRDLQKPVRQVEEVSRRLDGLQEAVDLLELQVRMNDEDYARLVIRVEAAETDIARRGAELRVLIDQRGSQIRAAFDDLEKTIRQIPMSEREILQESLDAISRWTDDVPKSLRALVTILRHVASAKIPFGRFIEVDVERLLDLFDVSQPVHR